MLAPLRALDALQPIDVDGRELLVASLAHAVDQCDRGDALLLRTQVFVQLEVLRDRPSPRARPSPRYVPCSSVPIRSSSSAATLPTSSTRARRASERWAAARSWASSSSRTSISASSSSSRSLRRFLRLSTSWRDRIELPGVRDRSVVHPPLLGRRLLRHRIDLVLEAHLVTGKLIEPQAELPHHPLGLVRLGEGSGRVLTCLEASHPRQSAGRSRCRAPGCRATGGRDPWAGKPSRCSRLPERRAAATLGRMQGEADGRVALVTGAGSPDGDRVRHREDPRAGGGGTRDRLHHRPDPRAVGGADRGRVRGRRVRRGSARTAHRSRRMVDGILELFGRIDILVNNAGMVTRRHGWVGGPRVPRHGRRRLGSRPRDEPGDGLQRDESRAARDGRTRLGARS